MQSRRREQQLSSSFKQAAHHLVKHVDVNEGCLEP
mgnify:CR=1 FL=1